ncbi:MAG: hypothetical protein LBK73_02455 [Treponema sp.]|jgi:restriction endonuclease|nr:hypothetical protein [Treponema sp.]
MKTEKQSKPQHRPANNWPNNFQNIMHLLSRANFKYFAAETKGSMSRLELQKIEEANIACACKYFARTGEELVMYDKIDSYETLINKVIR